METQTLFSVAWSEPYRMSVSSRARHRARSSIFIFSESLFHIRSHRRCFASGALFLCHSSLRRVCLLTESSSNACAHCLMLLSQRLHPHKSHDLWLWWRQLWSSVWPHGHVLDSGCGKVLIILAGQDIWVCPSIERLRRRVGGRGGLRFDMYTKGWKWWMSFCIIPVFIYLRC